LIGAGHLHGQSEGFFFPGELPCEGCPTIPVEIEQGTNIEFRGMDEEVHQVTAKKKRAGRPLFKSAPVKDGATALVLTGRLKPGSYEFFCFFHPEMRGVLEVTG
jgi:plastocyanin